MKGMLEIEIINMIVLQGSLNILKEKIFRMLCCFVQQIVIALYGTLRAHHSVYFELFAGNLSPRRNI